MINEYNKMNFNYFNFKYIIIYLIIYLNYLL